jgi:hypothetical protein
MSVSRGKRLVAAVGLAGVTALVLGMALPARALSLPMPLLGDPLEAGDAAGAEAGDDEGEGAAAPGETPVAAQPAPVETPPPPEPAAIPAPASEPPAVPAPVTLAASELAAAQEPPEAEAELAASGGGGLGEDAMPHAPPGVVARWLGLPGDWTSRGELLVEGRAFDDDGNGATRDGASGLAGRLELRHTHGRWEQKARVFGRVDALDERRSIAFVEEAFIQVQGERLRLRIGADVLNWTATEAFHPADVINARNLDSDLENMDKLGEPMVQLHARLTEGTTLSAFYLPFRTAPRFTSPASRLTFAPPGLDLRGRPLMVSRDGQLTEGRFGFQAALLLRQTLGPADISLHALEHMDRSQPLVVVGDRNTPPRLLLQTVRQLGGTYQHVVGPLVLKLEAAYRDFVGLAGPLGALPARDHGTIAAGLEYTIGHRGGGESMLLLEGQAVLLQDAALRAAQSPFQRDVMGGYRLALNDENSRELMILATVDLERAGEYLLSASYQQRLGDSWTVRAGLRLFQAPAPDDPFAATGLQPLRDADHVRLTLTRHF